MTLSRPRRWSDLSRVERVDLYTRLSLHLLLWGFCGFLLLTTIRESTSGAHLATVLGGGIIVTALGSLVMSSVIAISPATGPLPWPRSSLLLVASGAYLGAIGLTSNDPVRVTVATVVVVTVTAAVGGLPDNRVTAALLVVSGLLLGLAGGELRSVVAGVVVSATLIFSVRVSLWLLGVVTELDVARLAQTQLAVAEERLRFSRDVHDVLGRRLSTIAVQSELAATLAARGDDRAAERMLEVRGVAHEALKEARELARGYRPTNLTHELDGARSLLRSAGIEVQLDVDVVPRAWHEAAGWVVRESVTNVLRHSEARSVRISYLDAQLRVDNDGARPDSADGPTDLADASGLRELRDRLDKLGATLLTRRSGEHWSVVAHLPQSGPISAVTISGVTDALEPARDDTRP